MNTFTIEDIRSWSPCYNPNRHLPEGWKGTAIDIVANDAIPFQDVLWVVARDEIIDKGLLRRFAAWCAAEALFVAKQTDSRSWRAVEVAVKFSLGQASEQERDAAWAAARDAAWAAAGDAARAAQRKKLLSMLREESDFTLSNILNDYPIERT